MSALDGSGDAQARLRHALALQQRGELNAAERVCRDLLAQHADFPGAQHLLALLLHAQGRSADALPWFERAGALGGDSRLWSNYSAALLASGRAADAAACARRAAEADPRHVGAWLNLGLALELLQDVGGATAALEHVLRLAPDSKPARRALARCRLRAGDAAAAFAALVPLPPGQDAASDLVRAEAQIALAQLDAADALLRTLARHAPTAAAALALQAKIAAARGRHGDELALLARVLEREPDNRHATVRSALIRLNRGEVEEGLAGLHGWLEQHADDQVVASNYLVACNYSERFDPAALLAEHRRLRPRPAAGAAWPGNWRRAASSKTRVGWVAASFGGLQEIFFADVLAALREIAPEFEHRLYAVAPNAAFPSAAFAGAEQLGTSEDARLLECLRGEGLDVAVDLIGRAAGNRAAVFAARVAPAQVGWMDQFHPSGIDAIDYLVTDPWLSPAGAEAGFSERLLRLPHGRMAYAPPPAAAVRIEGASEKRFVSLNRFAKITPHVIEVWSAILRQLPQWSLLLKGKGGDDPEFARLCRERFAMHGIHAARIAVEGAGPYAEAMETYQRAAIALDPFPFSGCSTTCDALWMGVPVITWPHATMASRQSAALLQALEIDDWIANSADDYFAKAVALAQDEPARRRWREQARERVRPALCDARRLARELVGELRALTGR